MEAMPRLAFMVEKIRLRAFLSSHCPSVCYAMHPGSSLSDALFMNTSASPFFWPNQFPTFKAEKGMTLHAPLSCPFQAYPTANKADCCFTAALDAKSETFTLFIVPLTSFGHWSVPTLISAILLLLFLGVKGALEATQTIGIAQ